MIYLSTLRLEELREFYGLTKKQLSRKLEISDSIYAKWENGKDIIPTRRIFQIAKFYDVNVDYLLGLTCKKKTIKKIKEIDRKIVASRCKEIRNDYNESLRTFAKRLNTSNSTWCAYESGKTLILCAFMLEINNFGNYSIDWILGLSNEKYIK